MSTNPTTDLENLTEEDAQKLLAGEAVRGPRMWRGRELAPLSGGLKDLRDKVVMPDDTAKFFDIALLHLLTEAHDADEGRRRNKRRALIMATDDVDGFRTEVNLLIDTLSDGDIAEGRKVVNDLLGIVKAAEVTIAGAKKNATAEPVAAAPSPTPTPSRSSRSRKKPAGSRSTSAGS